MRKTKIRDKKEISKSIFKGLDEAAKTAAKITVISVQWTKDRIKKEKD